MGRIGLFGAGLALACPLVAFGSPPFNTDRDTTRAAYASSNGNSEAGRFLRHSVDPNEYGANPQNWDAAQDSSGIFYVANTDGVLVYDGRSWRTLPVDNRSRVRSVAADGDGRIFVGAGQEFGVLRSDERGRARYVSLIEHVPEEDRSFNDVWRTVAGQNHVYFQSHRRLFRWTPEAEALQVWRPPAEGRFRSLDVVRDTLFVHVRNEDRGGLMTVREDSLRLVPGGEMFADRAVKFVAPHAEHGLLVGTLNGLFVREGSSFRPFRTEADEVLDEAWVYKGTLLPDGTIAIATIDQGLLLLKQDGTVRRHLSARSNPVTGLFADREGGLWALLDGGLLRYDLGAPFTEHNESTGLDASRVVDVARHRDALYAATNQSVYRLDAPDDTLATFERIRGLALETTSQIESYALLSAGEDLLIGTAHGLARRGPDGALRYLFTNMPVYDLLRSRVDSSRLYAATENGVRLLTRTSEGWEDSETYLPGLDVKSRSLAESSEGALWIGTEFLGVFRARAPANPDSVAVDSFGTEHNLPDDQVAVYRWQGQTVFGTNRSVMQFSESPEPRFEPIASIDLPSPSHPVEENVIFLETDERGRTWGYTPTGAAQWVSHDSTWLWSPGPLVRFEGDRVETVEVEEGGDTVWFGMAGNRLLQYVPQSAGARATLPTLIREVAINDADSLLAIEGEAPSLSHNHTGIRLAYGTPSLVQPDDIRYQYKLEGQSNAWSDWTSHSEQTFRTLTPGTYRFSVRARTAYGDTTATARYAFSVLPPWYRTWWAYGVYVMAVIALIAGAVRWRTWRLRRRQEELEATVAKRTREIETQKQKLAEQAERLEELDAAKSRFFANVSHEFRTPLTLIQGPARRIRKRMQRGRIDPEGDAEQLSLIERNAGRLLRLVDQILGIAQLEAGTYELDARATDLGAEVRRIARTFEPLAERAGLALAVQADDSFENADAVYVDRQALEHILSNLLSNAIKFTPAGGTITVQVREFEDETTVSVADTGPGIPEEQQEAIFDRFQQVDDTSTRPQEGAGIGLAFAADLVDLHGGSIELESTEGHGTTFTVRFLRGPGPLSDEQLSDSSAADAASTNEHGEDGTGVPGPVAADDLSTADASSTEDPDAEMEATGKVVLVVDDNAEIRQYVRSVLETEFTVLEAADGEEGAAVAREQLPDVILADVMMPGVDGHEMTRRLKADPETEAIPVIMVTARAGTDEEVRGLQIGADDYVTKPFDAAVLRQRVKGVVAMQQRLRRRLKEAIDADDEPSSDGTDRRSKIEKEARRIILEHLTDSGFGTNDLAGHMAMSRSTLYRRFDEETDTTPAALLTEVRMEKATELLQSGEGTVTQVAYAVGYDSLSSFSRAYRKHTGTPPSAVTA